jgi:hypothetical protein
MQIDDKYTMSFPVQTIQLPRDPSKIIDSNYFYQKFVPQGDSGTLEPTYLLSIHKWAVLRNSIQRDDYVLLDMPQQICTKNLLLRAAQHLAHYLQILRLKPNAAAPSVFVDTSKLLDLHSFFPMRRTFPEIRWEASRGKWVLPCISCPRFAENVAKAASLEQRVKKSTIEEYLNCMHLRQAYKGEVPLVYVDITDVTTKRAQIEREILPCVQKEGASINPQVQELAKKSNFSEKILKLHPSTCQVIEGLPNELQGKVLSFLPIFASNHVADDKADLYTAPCLARLASATQCSEQFGKLLYQVSDDALYSSSLFFNPKIHLVREYVIYLKRIFKDVNPPSIARLSLSFPNLRALNLYIRHSGTLAAISDNDDRVMVQLQKFTKLQELFLTGFAITSKSLQFLPASIKRLDLANISMSEDLEMQYLSHTSLEDLSLRFIKQLKGDNFDRLPHSLKYLTCFSCDLSDAAISKLQKIPLKSLSIVDCDKVTGIYFQNLPQSLKYLSCEQCSGLTDAALNFSTTQLQDIYMWQNDNITGKYFVASKMLKSITIFNTKNLSDELILGCRNSTLEKMELYNTPITGKYFDQLPASVKILKCIACPNITQNLLTNLGGCTCLELLGIDNLEIEDPNVYPLPKSVKNLHFKNSYWKKIDGKFYSYSPDGQEQLSYL